MREAAGLVVFCIVATGAAAVVSAQTTSPSLNTQQNIVPALPQPLTGSAVTPIQAAPAPASPTVSVTPSAGTSPSSSIGKSFGAAGRGLPGFSGGPPVNASPGSQDPSSTFMRPTTIPPLLCDPAVDLPC